MPADETVIEVIGRLYAELHRGRPISGRISRGSRLDSDLGLDSLARIELVHRLEQRFHVHLPEMTVASASTVADLLRAIAQARVADGSMVAPAAGSTAVHTPTRDLRAGADVSDLTGAQTLQEVLTWHAAHQPKATHAIFLDGQTPIVLSYRELHEGAIQVALELARLGVDPGSTVALMLPTGVDYFIAYFGVLFAGAVPVPIYPPLAAQLAEHVRRHQVLLDTAGVQALITVAQAQTIARLLRARVRSLRRVLTMDRLAQARAPAGVTASLADRLADADSLALLQFTSGSTGAPKGVMLKHGQLLANIRAMGRRIGVEASDVFVSWLPLYHDMGLIGAWLGALYFGRPIVIMSPTRFLRDPACWLRAIRDYRGTLSGSPNFGYELCVRRVAESELESLDLRSWRMAFNGAEPVQAATLQRFCERFARCGLRPESMTPVYGLAEAAVGLTCPEPGRGPLVDSIDREQLASAGRAIPLSEDSPRSMRLVSSGPPLDGYRVRILDASGIQQPERVEGAVQFAGPSAADGYFRNDAATTALVDGDWRNTGDRGYLAGGELYLTGRAKDIIIRRGRHIYPEEIERSVGELDGVRTGCVVTFGVLDPSAGTERLIVLAETAWSQASARSTLSRAIGERVVGCIGEPPDEVLLVAPHTVLKTSSGKLRRAATAAAFESGALSRARASTRRQLLRLAVGSAAPALRGALPAAAHAAYGIYAWVVFVSVALPVIGVCLCLQRRQAWRVTHLALRAVLRACGIAFSVGPREGRIPAVARLLVVNHCSYLDSLFLLAMLPTPHRFVANFAWQDWPVLHAYLGRLGTIFIDRSTVQQAAQALGKLEAALARGDALVVFPEGTFTRQAGLRPFRLGAFEAAVYGGAAIVPITLRGTRSMLRDGQRLPRRFPVEAIIGDPLAPTQGSEPFAAALRLRDAARAQILRNCGEPDLQ